MEKFPIYHYVHQPSNSRLCGQCVVSMLTGKRVETIIRLFGHSSGTYTRELVRVLNLLNIKTSNKLTLLKGKSLPELCIVKILYLPNGRHWAIHYKGIIYCSSEGVYPMEDYLQLSDDNIRVSSFLEIFK